MNKVYRAHEFAQLAGVTVKALHHYDRLGLLKPGRSAAGYRLYHERDLERLEQIVTLKFLGIPLKQVRSLLDRPDLALRDALRMQIAALEEKQQQLDRALRAIRAAESQLEPGKTAPHALLKRIIEAIDMQDSVEAMKKYFSDEAWAKQRGRYEHGPSPEWQAVYREANALLKESPDSDPAMAMARRWLDLLERDTGTDPAVLIGRTLAWEDREHWPAALKREIEEYNLEAVYKFFSRAALAHRKKFDGDDFWVRRDPRAQASVAWYRIFLEPRIAVQSKLALPDKDTVQAQWVRYLHRSTRVDPEVQARSIRAYEETQERHPVRWAALADEALANLGQEPGSAGAQERARRWMNLWDGFLNGDMGVAVALRKGRDSAGLIGREEITDWIGAALAWPLRPYFSQAAWAAWTEQSRRLSMEELQRSARAHICLLRDVNAALGKDPEGEQAHTLAARWEALVEQDAGGDPEIVAGIREAWKRRGEWPERLRAHVASLYLTDLATFDASAAFLDEASSRRTAIP